MNKRDIIKGIVLLLISIGLIFAFYFGRHLFTNDYTLKEKYVIICDGLFIPTAILLGLAGLKFAAYEGTFDSLTYGIKSFFHLRKPSKKFENSQTLGDYVIQKNETRTLNVTVELALGLTFLLVSIVFFILYKVTK